MTVKNPALIQSYEDAENLFATARNKTLGKPIRSNYRLFKKDNGDFSLRPDYCYTSCSYEYATITPDNKLIFTCTEAQFFCHTNSLVLNLHKAVPIVVSRVKTGLYHMMHVREMRREMPERNCPYRIYEQQTWTAERGYMFKQGLEFDLHTGTPINAEPRRCDRLEDRDRAREYRAAVKHLRGMVKTIARLGGLTDYANHYTQVARLPLAECAAYAAQHNLRHFAQRLVLEPEFEVLLRALTSGVADDAFLSLLVYEQQEAGFRNWGRQPLLDLPAESYVRRFDALINRFRDQIKTHYNVFTYED